jgi:hypothetical protein
VIAVDWNAVGAIGTLIGLAFAAVGIYISIRKNRSTLEAVNRRVTTPDSVTGTIGEEVANVANRTAFHEVEDDARFKKLWTELGREEPS